MAQDLGTMLANMAVSQLRALHAIHEAIAALDHLVSEDSDKSREAAAERIAAARSDLDAALAALETLTAKNG
jgi:hypothetical protein